jgi:predicted glycosyltransferase
MSNRSIVMYSPDTVGLGHVRRNSTIATQVVERNPDCSVVLLVGSAAGPVFALPPGVDSIKLPSVQKLSSGDWCARSLSISNQVTQRMRSGLIRETIATLRPDVLLVDHLPAGIWGELLPVFEFIRSRRLPTRIVLGLRDILDDPRRVSDRWSRDGIYDIIRRYYDSVFVYGDRAVFDSAAAYGLNEEICSDIRFMGYVTGDAAVAPSPAERLPARRDEKFVVVTAGGGYDAYPMMAASLEALALVPRSQRIRSVAIAGPLMPDEYFARLKLIAEPCGVELVRFSPKLRTLLQRADLVVTMGGYNSMLEITGLGKATIVIPRSGPSMEQTVRSQMFEQMGFSRHVPIDAAAPEYLAQAIVAGLAKPPRPMARLRLDGAGNAAAALVEQMAEAGGKRPQVRAQRSRTGAPRRGENFHAHP